MIGKLGEVSAVERMQMGQKLCLEIWVLFAFVAKRFPGKWDPRVGYKLNLGSFSTLGS